MSQDIVKIELKAEGSKGSGKSLAISDMMAGLREKHHYAITELSHVEGVGYEVKTIELKILRSRL